MKVLWVMKEFGVGGAERLLLEVAARLATVEFVPVAVVDTRRDLVPHLENAGMAPVSLGARNPLDMAWLLRLRSLVKSEQPDVVHVQNPYPGAGSRLALRGLKVPLVYTEHNLWESFRGTTRIANMLTFWLNDASIVVSDAVSRSIAGSLIGRFYAGRLVTIRNGIDPNCVRQEGAKGTDANVRPGSYGAVAHLKPGKALDVLIKASSLMKERGSEAQCYIVGSGPMAKTLEDQRQKLGAKQVHLLGARQDARAILARLKVCVIPSRFEGLPMVLLEALALGVPVVTTPVGGIPEVITHGETGLLVPSDDPEALADAINEILMDEDLAARLARRGRELAETEFHIDGMVARLFSVYREVTSR